MILIYHLRNCACCQRGDMVGITGIQLFSRTLSLLLQFHVAERERDLNKCCSRTVWLFCYELDWFSCLFFLPRELGTYILVWICCFLQYSNAQQSCYTVRLETIRLSIRPNNWIYCRMRSIIDHLKQSRNFPRLRMGMTTICSFFILAQGNIWKIIPKKCCAGIGRPPDEMGAIGFVLRSFSKEEKEEVCKLIHENCFIAMPVAFFLSRPLYLKTLKLNAEFF